MANPGRSWNPPSPPTSPPKLPKPPSGYQGVETILSSDWEPHSLTLVGGPNRQMPWPPVPKVDIERITGKTHLSLFNEREAEREYEASLRGEEYEASLRGEDYVYQTPETDEDGYLVVPAGTRPAAFPP